MKTTKWISLLGMLLLSLGVQAQPHQRMDPGMHIEHLADRLDVSDEQRDALRRIADEQRPRMRSLHDRLRENHRALRDLDPAATDYAAGVESLAQQQGELAAEMVRARSDMRQAVHGVLTPEQREQARQLREHTRVIVHGGRGPHAGQRQR